MLTHAADDQIPWTTARCNRLLRPISSRLAALRKATENARAQRLDSKKTQAKDEEDEDTAGRAPRRTWKKIGDPENDIEWVPEGKPLKTYKRCRNGRAPARPKAQLPLGPAGEITVPTPFISRTLQHVEESPRFASPLQVPQRGRKPLHLQPAAHLKDVRKETSSDDFGHISGVYAGFEKALEATAEYGSKRERKGTRSLRATCLRQVPAYIELEESFQKEEDEDNTEDIAARIYNELEHQAFRDENERQALGHVVRASAIKMVAEALRDGLLPQIFLLELIKLCTKIKAWDAGEEILLVALDALQPAMDLPNHPQDDIFQWSSHTVLMLFRNYVETSRSWTLFYRTMTNLLMTRKLPVEWMATRSMLPIWTKIIRSINSHEYSLGPTLELLDTVLLRSFGLEQTKSCLRDGTCPAEASRRDVPKITVKPSVRNALNNTIDSMLTIFTCAGFSAKEVEGDKRPHCNRYLDLLDYLCQSLSMELASAQRLPGGAPSIVTTHTERACALSFAHLLLSIKTFGATQCLHRSILRLRHVRRLATRSCVKMSSVIDTISKVMNSVARSYGHVAQRDHFDTMKDLVQSLLVLSPSCELKDAHFVDLIAYSAAMRFSEETQDKEHFQYAKSLERAMKSSTVSLTAEESPSESSEESEAIQEETVDLQTGYRWEEGIEEWILCPPAIAHGKAPNAGKPLSEQDSDSSLHSSRISDLVSTPTVALKGGRPKQSGSRMDLLDSLPSSPYPPNNMSPQVIIYVRPPMQAAQSALPRKRSSPARQVSLAESSDRSSSEDSVIDESEDSMTSVSEDDYQRTRHQTQHNTKKRSFAQVMRQQRAKRSRISLESSFSRETEDDEDEVDDVGLDDDLVVDTSIVSRSTRIKKTNDVDTSLASIGSATSRGSSGRKTRGLKSQTKHPSNRFDVAEESVSEEDELLAKPEESSRTASRTLPTAYSRKTRTDREKSQNPLNRDTGRIVERASAARGSARMRKILDAEMSGDELSFG